MADAVLAGERCLQNEGSDENVSERCPGLQEGILSTDRWTGHNTALRLPPGKVVAAPSRMEPL